MYGDNFKKEVNNINVKYTKEEFFYEIKRLYKEYNKIDINIWKKYSKINVGFNTYCNKYGEIKNICKEINIPFSYYNEKNRDELILIGKNILESFGVITKEICTENGISSCVVRRIFGGFQNFYKEIGYNNNFHRNVRIEDLMEDILKAIEKYGSNSYSIYKKYGKFSQTVVDRFGGWRCLMKKIGIEPISTCVGFDEIVRQIDIIIKKHGFISSSLINEECTFSWQAVMWYFENIEDLCLYFGDKNLFKYGRSTKERLIKEYLTLLNIEFTTEKTFSWLKTKENKNMYLDFFIPEKNLAIEYDGEQHFKYVKMFHKTEKEFERRKKLDVLKNELLKKHKVNIFRIPYTDNIDIEYIENIYNQF